MWLRYVTHTGRECDENGSMNIKAKPSTEVSRILSIVHVFTYDGYCPGMCVMAASSCRRLGEDFVYAYICDRDTDDLSTPPEETLKPGKNSKAKAKSRGLLPRLPCYQV